MKILGINCSPRRGKTTFYALQQCMDSARAAAAGVEVEILELAGMNLHGCCACGLCKTSLACSIEDDFVKLLPRVGASDIRAMIIGTPVYLGTMTSQCKAFLDRSVMFRRNGFLFQNRVGGVLAVGGARNGGQELTIQAVHAAMLCHNMIVVSDGMRSSHFGATLHSGAEGGIEKDDEGLATAHNLGRRIAKLINMLWE